MQNIVHIENSSPHQSGNNGNSKSTSPYKNNKKRALLDELKGYYYVISL